MGYLPIFVAAGGRRCIVIGGGDAAESKVCALVEAGAVVTVVSREISAGIKCQVDGGKVRYLPRQYEYGDLRGNWLVYIATEDVAATRAAAEEASELQILLNVVDDAELSSFISPATFKRGALQVAISTGGSSPTVARMLRERLEQQILPEYALVLDIMRRARQLLRNREPDPSARARILKSLAAALLDSV
jgi:precorrin-2 dehydrogenase / sirohydrochlorin ferrochelatase